MEKGLSGNKVQCKTYNLFSDCSNSDCTKIAVFFILLQLYCITVLQIIYRMNKFDYALVQISCEFELIIKKHYLYKQTFIWSFTSNDYLLALNLLIWICTTCKHYIDIKWDKNVIKLPIVYNEIEIYRKWFF